MEQRKVITKPSSREKLSSGSLTFTKGVLRCINKIIATTILAKAPKAAMAISVIPRGSVKSRNSMVFGTHVS